MNTEPKETLNPRVVYSGKLFKVEQTEQPDGRVFEVARRAPGVRLIISDKVERKILLTREFRKELNKYDYRLPGGKVFDSLDEWHAFKQTGRDILEAAIEKAIDEGAEEAGVDISAVDLYQKSTLGATVEWDLFVFDVAQWRPHVLGQQLEDGEEIDADNWFTYEEAEQMIFDSKMQEDRVALILLKWLHAQNEAENLR